MEYFLKKIGKEIAATQCMMRLSTCSIGTVGTKEIGARIKDYEYTHET
jgi:hypothetical protein